MNFAPKWTAAVRRVSLGLAVAMLLTAVFACVARAGAGDEVVLTPGSKALKDLSGEGVAVRQLKPGTSRGKSYVFPVDGIDMNEARLMLNVDGGIEFSKGKRKLSFRPMRVEQRLEQQAFKFVATLEGSRYTLFTVDMSGAELTNGGSTVTGLKLALAKQVASKISKKFGVKVAAGMSFGTLEFTLTDVTP